MTKHKRLLGVQLLQAYVDCTLMFVYSSSMLNYENFVLEEGRKGGFVWKKKRFAFRAEFGRQKKVQNHKL